METFQIFLKSREVTSENASFRGVRNCELFLECNEKIKAPTKNTHDYEI